MINFSDSRMLGASSPVERRGLVPAGGQIVGHPSLAGKSFRTPYVFGTDRLTDNLIIALHGNEHPAKCCWPNRTRKRPWGDGPLSLNLPRGYGKPPTRRVCCPRDSLFDLTERHRLNGTTTFTGALDVLRSFCGASAQAPRAAMRKLLWVEMLRVIAADLVPLRPDRWEPRAVQRRPKNIPAQPASPRLPPNPSWQLLPPSDKNLSAIPGRPPGFPRGKIGERERQRRGGALPLVCPDRDPDLAVRRAICVHDCKSGVGAISSRMLGLETRLEIRGDEGPAFAQFSKLLTALADVRFRQVLEVTHLAAPARCRINDAPLSCRMVRASNHGGRGFVAKRGRLL